MNNIKTLFALIAFVAALIFSSIISAQHFGDWAAPVSMESIPGTGLEFSTAFNDGYSYQPPDGLSFYTASNRPGVEDQADIFVTTREKRKTTNVKTFTKHPETSGRMGGAEFDFYLTAFCKFRC